MSALNKVKSMRPIEHKGQRVITFNEIDRLHDRPSGTAKRNFNANRSHFVIGEDYWEICGDEIRTHKLGGSMSRKVILLSESGYLLICKSLNGDFPVIARKLRTTSLFVADDFEKRHDNILRDIKTLDCSSEFATLNFEECSYNDRGRQMPMYKMTRDGHSGSPPHIIRRERDSI